MCLTQRQHQHQAKRMMVGAFRVRSNTFTEFSTARLSAKDDTGTGVQRKGANAASKASVAPPQSSPYSNMQPTSGLMVPAGGRSQALSESEHSATPIITGTPGGASDAPTAQGPVMHANAGPKTTTTSKAAGRQSGRLREKGPTTYNARGEVFRAGKRVNEYKYADM